MNYFFVKKIFNDFVKLLNTLETILNLKIFLILNNLYKISVKIYN